MVLYVSGPMTGIPEFNYPAFELACRQLRARGFTVVSPHEVAHPENGVVGSLPWTEYLRRDIQEFIGAGCEGIVLLQGWPKSRGARLELSIALALEWKVFYFTGYDNLIEMDL